MTALRIAPLAVSDLDQVWDYIARVSPVAADRLLDRFEDIFAMLSRQPLIGESRDEIRAGLRSFPVRAYVVYCSVIANRVNVARVLHGARDPNA